MQAPLGRAVIGGLVCSTFSTLIVLPAVFSLMLGNRKPKPVSIDPDDPDGLTFDGGEQVGHTPLPPGNDGASPVVSLPAENAKAGGA